MAGPMPPVPNTVSFQMQGTIPGEIWENVLHYAYTGPTPTQATMATFAQAAAISWTTHVTPLQSTAVTFAQCVAIDMASDFGAEGTFVANQAGTRAGGEVPANAAVLVSYPAPTRYRGGHFRSYVLAGVTTDMSNPMNWSNAFTGVFNPGWQSFLNGIIGVGSGGTQIVQLVGLRRHGRYLPNAGPPNYVLTSPIQYTLLPTSIVVHNQVASQKGRIGRRSK